MNTSINTGFFFNEHIVYEHVYMRSTRERYCESYHSTLIMKLLKRNKNCLWYCVKIQKKCKQTKIIDNVLSVLWKIQTILLLYSDDARFYSLFLSLCFVLLGVHQIRWFRRCDKKWNTSAHMWLGVRQTDDRRKDFRCQR